MSDIVLKANDCIKAKYLLKEALQTEATRFKYSLELAKKRLIKFETKYNISSEKFINEWASEDMEGKDMEYIEWSGEFELAMRLKDRIATLESIEYVTS